MLGESIPYAFFANNVSYKGLTLVGLKYWKPKAKQPTPQPPVTQNQIVHPTAKYRLGPVVATFTILLYDISYAHSCAFYLS